MVIRRKCDLESKESISVQDERFDMLMNNTGVMKCRKMLTKVRMKKRSLL